MALVLPSALAIRPLPEGAAQARDLTARQEIESALSALRTPTFLLVSRLEGLAKVLAKAGKKGAHRTEAQAMGLDLEALVALAADLLAVLEKHSAKEESQDG